MSVTTKRPRTRQIVSQATLAKIDRVIDEFLAAGDTAVPVSPCGGSGRSVEEQKQYEDDYEDFYGRRP
ncbi:MAG: hypothetical protein WCH05_10030 [Chlorobiaceae bacterium]